MYAVQLSELWLSETGGWTAIQENAALFVSMENAAETANMHEAMVVAVQGDFEDEL